MNRAEEGKRVLIIEDEPDMALGLKDAFELEGYKVCVVYRGREGVELARRGKFDCIILDLMLPDVDGLKVCEVIRSFNSFVPVVMLTARSQEVDKLRGFKSGADDYVTKPFSIAELLLRVKAILRRVEKGRAPVAEVFNIGDATVNLKVQTITTKGKTYQIGYYECEILRLLYENANKPISRQEILNRVWGVDANPSNRTVDNFIVKLRKKIEPDAGAPKFILTIHGQGYKLAI